MSEDEVLRRLTSADETVPQFDPQRVLLAYRARERRRRNRSRLALTGLMGAALVIGLTLSLGNDSTDLTASDGDTAGTPRQDEDVQVPEVTGLDFSRATSKLTAAGLTYRVTNSSPLDAGALVLDQFPIVGQTVPPGTEVSLTFSAPDPSSPTEPSPSAELVRLTPNLPGYEVDDSGGPTSAEQVSVARNAGVLAVEGDLRLVSVGGESSVMISVVRYSSTPPTEVRELLLSSIGGHDGGPTAEGVVAGKHVLTYINGAGGASVLWAESTFAFVLQAFDGATEAHVQEVFAALVEALE